MQCIDNNKIYCNITKHIGHPNRVSYNKNVFTAVEHKILELEFTTQNFSLTINTAPFLLWAIYIFDVQMYYVTA